MTEEKTEHVDAGTADDAEETPVETTETDVVDETVEAPEADDVSTDEADVTAADEPEADETEEPEADKAEADETDDEAETAKADKPEADKAEAAKADKPEADKAEAVETDKPEIDETSEVAAEETETTEADEPEAAEPAKIELHTPGMDWYVLRVQSNKEDAVLENLEKRIKAAGLEQQIARVLVPTEKVREMKGGKKRVTERKIYPGYVMVEMMMTDESWYLVRETPGIGDFVGGAPNTRPMPMPKHEVDKMLGEADKIDEEQPKLKIAFREGEAVKINEGPFENFNGVVQEVIASKGLVKVEVTIFGRPTPVELEYWQIETI